MARQLLMQYSRTQEEGRWLAALGIRYSIELRVVKQPLIQRGIRRSRALSMSTRTILPYTISWCLNEELNELLRRFSQSEIRAVMNIVGI